MPIRKPIRAAMFAALLSAAAAPAAAQTTPWTVLRCSAEGVPINVYAIRDGDWREYHEALASWSGNRCGGAGITCSVTPQRFSLVDTQEASSRVIDRASGRLTVRIEINDRRRTFQSACEAVTSPEPPAEAAR